MTPEFAVPDVLGEIIAWRAWKVIGGNERLPMLSSVTHQTTIWHPAHWTFADCGGSKTCRRGGSLDGRVPGEECSCGLYAAKTREQLVARLGYGKESPDSPTPVFIGEVGLTGKVIPGTQGWRAEKGRIVRLYVPFHRWRMVEPLAQLYRVPVLLDNTQKVAPTFGVTEGE